MNAKRLHILAIFLLTTIIVSAQQFTLSGKVSDQDGNAIELATVACLEQGASMVGYQTKTRVLRRPRGNQKLQVQLQPMEALKEVVVTERRRQTTGTEQLDVKNIKQTPSTTGNAVEELVQQQAGVSTHNELSSQYNVRGGSFDENSVYINNVEGSAGRLERHQLRYGREDWLLEWRIRSEIWRQNVECTRYPLPPPYPLRG